MYLTLPNDYSVLSLQILETISLTKILKIDNGGSFIQFEITLPFSHHKHHAPPKNPTNYMNISPVEGWFFSVTQSMQNV